MSEQPTEIVLRKRPICCVCNQQIDLQAKYAALQAKYTTLLSEAQILMDACGDLADPTVWEGVELAPNYCRWFIEDLADNPPWMPLRSAIQSLCAMRKHLEEQPCSDK